MFPIVSQSTIIRKILETNSSLYEITHYGVSSISIFQEIFASTDKTFVSGGGLSNRQYSMKF